MFASYKNKKFSEGHSKNTSFSIRGKENSNVEPRKKSHNLISFYRQVSVILDKVKDKKGSVQSLCLSSDVQQKKKTVAVVIETMKYSSIIDHLIDTVGITLKSKNKQQQSTDQLSFLKVIIYDGLLGKENERIRQQFDKFKNHSIIKVFKKYYTALNQALVMLKIERQASSNEELLPQHLQTKTNIESSLSQNEAKYVRVNIIKIDVKQAIEELVKDGFLFNKNDSDVKLDGDSVGSVAIDKHINHLLVIKSSLDSSTPGYFEAHSHRLVREGKLIVQEKASCLPVFILWSVLQETKLLQVQNIRNFDFIDACAAPGNKTSYLASLIHQLTISQKKIDKKCRLFAFDRNRDRFNTLSNRLKQAGALHIVEPMNRDFLTIPNHDLKYENVRVIMLDPSCSGSGIKNRTTYDNQDNTGELLQSNMNQRLKSLSSFQLKLLKHALSFPNVQLVVYSTCSIHQEENESVVYRILSDEKISKQWSLYPIFPEFETRGEKLNVPKEENGPSGVLEDFERWCIRTYPERDGTIGFFVAAFVRRDLKLPEENVNLLRFAKDSGIAESRDRNLENNDASQNRGGATFEAGTDDSTSKRHLGKRKGQKELMKELKKKARKIVVDIENHH